MHKNFRPIIVVSVTNNERHGVVRSTVSMAIVFNESRSSKSLTAIQGEKILSFPGSPLSEILYYILYFWPESSFFLFLFGRRQKEKMRRCIAPGPLSIPPPPPPVANTTNAGVWWRGEEEGRRSQEGAASNVDPAPHITAH